MKPQFTERQKEQMQDLQTKLNQELESVLTENNFPIDEIPVDFIDLLKKVFKG